MTGLTGQPAVGVRRVNSGVRLLNMTRKKIGKWPGRGDEYGFYPNVFSACINRELARRRRRGDLFVGGAIVDDDLLIYAACVKGRFVRRYGQPNNGMQAKPNLGLNSGEPSQQSLF